VRAVVNSSSRSSSSSSSSSSNVRTACTCSSHNSIRKTSIRNTLTGCSPAAWTYSALAASYLAGPDPTRINSRWSAVCRPSTNQCGRGSS
jgi:hypothetical protein